MHDNHELQHFGVKGMKWGVRRAKREQFKLEAAREERRQLNKAVEFDSHGPTKMLTNYVNSSRRAQYGKRLKTQTRGMKRVQKRMHTGVKITKEDAAKALETRGKGLKLVSDKNPITHRELRDFNVDNIGSMIIFGPATGIGLAFGARAMLGSRHAKNYKDDLLNKKPAYVRARIKEEKKKGTW